VRRGLISPEFRLIGFARKAMTDDEFRARMRKTVPRNAGPGDDAAWPDFAGRLSYITSEFDGDNLHGYAELTRRVEQLDRGTGAGAAGQMPMAIMFVVEGCPILVGEAHAKSEQWLASDQTLVPTCLKTAMAAVQADPA